MTAGRPERAAGSGHIVAELGLRLEVEGDALRGRAVAAPEMLVPGTGRLRTSVLAVWADHICGLLAGVSIAPRVPVTLDLDVHLPVPPSGVDDVEAVGRTLKRGRTVTVVGVEFVAGGRPLAFSTGTFVPVPDASLTMPVLAEVVAMQRLGGRLREPLAERARCRRVARGTVELPWSEDGLNASGTINGGLVALAVEEAALSLAEPGATLSSLAIRYLRPARVGPVLATAESRHGLGRVTVRDAGGGDRVTATATTRLFAPSPH